MKTHVLYRVVVIVLTLLLLAGVGNPVHANPQPAGVGRRRTRAALAPPWQPPFSEVEGRVVGGGAPLAFQNGHSDGAPIAFQNGHSDGAPIEPELLRDLLAAGPDDSFRVVVRLREQVNFQLATAGALNASEARSRLVSALQYTANRSQSLLRSYLEGARAAGRVQSYTSFWIVNEIAIHADRDAVFALADRPEVAAVHLDHYRQWVTAETPMSNVQSPTSTEWGIVRIRADEVWASLNISGTGVVVAGMDTGVDWFHPALRANYRGYNPHGPANHTYSWYDATNDGALYPVDGHGHGSHTMGTIVGQEGIGVAPGARWIGAKVLNSQGYGYDSWIHAGFQWLLAPGGDPAQSPDVVNNSWGNSNGGLTTFQPDLQALRAAGILAVFANGNEGPGGGTVGSPASLPEAFAVGATDFDDEVASFSSRGPSPWGEVRPHVAAPGVNVYSCLPGGAYGLMNGTSMATPHVAGIAALLHSLSPTLSITRTLSLITSTVVPLGSPIPNNDTGWGRVDAFAAAVALAQSGLVTGTVTQSGGGAVIAGATVAASAHGGGSGGADTTGDDGRYLLALSPAIYDVTASAFGYAPYTIYGVEVLTGVTAVENFILSALPTGSLRGQVTDAVTGQPVAATVTVLDTPLEAVGSDYVFTPPAGDYVVRAHHLGYRVVTATAVVVAGQATVVDLALPPAPSILLVDSGPWYYGSQIGYFRQALDDLAYAYEEQTIKHLPDEAPTAADLIPYDVVVWSAPEDAPGYIGAQHAITSYLSSGGRLLLSGQDVGFMDGGGAGLYWFSYYQDYLKARYAGDNAPSRVLDGLDGDIFAGMTFTITGAGGADNQDFPDEISVDDPDAAAPLLTYRDGGCGGMRIGECLDYRAVYLSFGIEGINERSTRRELLGRALDWLVAPLPAAGLELQPVAQMHIGPPGSIVTHAVRVRHVGQGGGVDNVSLSLDGASWMAQLSASSLSLSPCTSATVILTVTVPAAAGWDAHDVVTLTAQSSISPTLAETAVITSKSPAPILLVDDDRWYPQEEKYEAALAEGGFHYDYWHTGAAGDEPGQGSPSLDVLQRYPILVWFTGYDWYAPITSGEEESLATYLDGGGRLFLSSQDFLYYHYDDHFSQNYLGALTYTEDVTPTLATGVPENPIGDRAGPYALNYPFPNWSDAVTPAPDVSVILREQDRRPIALARQEGDYKTTFFSFPHEALPEAGRSLVMERAVGWLSWLGASTFAADRGTASGGDTLTYTIALRNDGSDTVTTSLSNTLPLSLTLVPGSLSGGAAYHTPTRRISWEGELGSGAAITFTYRATVTATLTPGSAIVNMARLGLEGQEIRFHRAAVVRVDAPDFSSSTFWCSPVEARPSRVVTCTLALANAGSVDAVTATATNPLPENVVIVPDSLAWAGGGAAAALTDTVRWTGPVSAQAQVTITYHLTLSDGPCQLPLYNAAFLEDGTGGAWERSAWVLVEPFRFYFPLMFRW